MSTFQESGIKAVVQDLDNFIRDVGRMDKAIQGIGSDTSSIRNWNDSITSTVANVGKVVTAAAVGATAAFGAFVADSVKKAADFEQSVADIGAIFGKTKEEIKPLGDLIRNLGLDPTLKVSSTEAADAIAVLGRNGLEMTEIIDGAAKSTILLANATGADFGLAADIATDAMAIFGIEAKDMDKAVSAIAGTTIKGKFGIEDYRYALAAAGGVAGALGVSFDDLNATIAGISPNFSSGERAGTSFKTFLQRIVPQSDEASDAMRSLGLFTGLTQKEFDQAQAQLIKYKDQLAALDPTSKNYAKRSEELTGKIDALESSLVEGQNAFFDLNGNMKDMDEIAGILNGALAGLSEEQKNATLSTIFGSDAIIAALAIAEMGTQGYNDLAASIDAVDAAQMAAGRNNTLQGSLEILAGIVETLQQDIGAKFNPVIRDMADQFSGFLSKNADRIVAFFGHLADGLRTAVDRFTPLVASWLPKFEEAIGDGSTVIDDLIDGVISVAKQVGDFAKGLQTAITPVAKWITENYTLKDVLNGIVTVVAVSLIPAITSFVTTITPVIALFGTIIELSSRMSESQKAIAAAVGVAVFALPPLVSGITSAIAAINAVIGAGSALVGLVTGGGGMVAALGALLNPVGLVVAAVAGLGIAWATDFGGIRTKTTEVVGQVGQTIGKWKDDSVKKFEEFHKSVGTTLASWSANIGTTLAGMSSTTGQTLATWAASSGGKFTKLRDDAKEAIDSMVYSVKASASGLASDAISSFSRFQNEGGGKFTKFRDDAKEAIDSMVYSVKASASGLASDAISSFSRFQNEGGGKFTKLRDDAKEAIDSMVYSIKASASGLASDAISSFSRFQNEGGGKFTRFRDDAKEAINSMVYSVKASASGLASDAISSFSRFQNEGTTAFTRFRENATGKVSELARDVPSRLRELVDAGLRIFDVGKWVQAGADIIGGVMTGLARAATAPLRWIENFASGLIGLFTSKLKIASPSQVFDEFGVNIMEGLEGGLESRSTGVLSFMDTFSDALVATTAEAQRQADKNFAALIDSATAAYSGYTVIAGDIARLSQEIDQSAIDAQNAEAAYAAAKAKMGNKAPDYDALVAQGKTPEEIKAIFDNYAEQERIRRESAAAFGEGRVSELIDQILNVVQTTFEKVGDTGIRSLGIDLTQFSNSAATNDAIAKLQLLAGTIQQNAQNATTVDDRNRLSSLYSDVTGRILPLLRSQMQMQQSREDVIAAAAAAEAEKIAAEAAAKAAAEAAAAALTQAQQRAAQQATSSFLLQAINPVIEQIRQLGQFGANLFFSNAEVSAFDSVGRAAFAQADQRLEETISYMLNRVSGDLSSLSSYSQANSVKSFLADALAEIEENLGQFSSLSFLGLSQADVSSRFGDIYGAYNLLSAAQPVLSGSSTTVNNQWGDVSVNNGMDIAALQALIEQAIANALP